MNAETSCFDTFIREENERLRERYSNIDDQRMILVQTVKLSEETGELADEILSREALQRVEKRTDANELNLANEIADVIITSRLLGESLDVDVGSAINRKMAEIEARYD